MAPRQPQPFAQSVPHSVNLGSETSQVFVHRRQGIDRSSPGTGQAIGAAISKSVVEGIDRRSLRKRRRPSGRRHAEAGGTRERRSGPDPHSRRQRPGFQDLLSLQCCWVEPPGWVTRCDSSKTWPLPRALYLTCPPWLPAPSWSTSWPDRACRVTAGPEALGVGAGGVASGVNALAVAVEQQCSRRRRIERRTNALDRRTSAPGPRRD